MMGLSSHRLAVSVGRRVTFSEAFGVSVQIHGRRPQYITMRECSCDLTCRDRDLAR